MIPVASRRRAHAAECGGAGAGLGQAERADQRPVGETRQVAFLLFRTRVALDVVHAEILVGKPREGDGLVPARKALAHQRRRKKVESGSAFRLRDRQAEVAGRAEATEESFWPPLVVVHLPREWRQLFARELVGQRQRVALIFGQFVGVWSRCDAGHRASWARM